MCTYYYFSLPVVKCHVQFYMHYDHIVAGLNGPVDFIINILRD